MPKASQTALSNIKGAFSQTSAAFFDCHEYRADSTVAFGERRSEANIATVGPKALLPGILLTLRTTVPIERGVTAIGDTVSAVLTRQIDNPVIPRGALATLRIVKMQPHEIGNRDGLLIGFQLLSIAVAGEKYDASGSLEAAKEKNIDKWDRSGQVAFLRTGRIDAGIELTWRTTSSR